MSAASILHRWTRRPGVAPAPALASTARSHVGRVRTVNEDRWLDRPDRALWAVADGMGGHAEGAAAATIAIQALAALADGDAALTRGALLAALDDANARIHGGAGTSGATIVALALDGLRATVAWAGDSRAYRIRGGNADRLTHDHSLVQELVDAGVLSESAAERHPRANVVTRALGVAASVAVEVATVTLAPGDRLLMCSDGISRSLHARDFTTLPTDLDACADRLLANALQRDGSDNATLVLVDLAGAG